MRRGKIVWTNGGNNVGARGINRPPLPRHFGRFSPVSDFFAKLPKGFTEESYSSRLIPGAMFLAPVGTIKMSGVWTGCDAEADQVSYVGRRAWNPSGRADVSILEEQAVCIYLEERRLTEWDGKGWARVLRPIFIANGSIVAALNATVMIPM